jgi:NAD(P)H-hydrate epimerase
VLVLCGPGNNGGDGWVIARALRAAGIRVRVWESGTARTADALAERTLAIDAGVPRSQEPDFDGEGIVVDAILGTGATLPVREDARAGVRAARHARSRGACLVAIDLPTGVDATTGATDAAGNVVDADLTVTFGTLKRGHLIARETCGDIVVADIGLPAADDLPTLIDARRAALLMPPMPADAHKGTRKRIAILGGAVGMAGAAILAARGALRSGAGLVKLIVHPDSLAAVQQAVPQALAATWGSGADVLARTIAAWADAVAIGPGLGANAESRALVERILAGTRVPVVLDADALNVFAGAGATLRHAIGDREALLTPHPAEMMRLVGAPDVAAVLAERFDIGRRLAADVGAAVLLKGIPTVISSKDGRRLVSAVGTAALATGGSGDVLTGMAATLLAQTGDAMKAGALAAWAHGRAAEIVTARLESARGVSLDEILEALPDALPTAWGERPVRMPYPIVCEIPAPPGRATCEASEE